MPAIRLSFPPGIQEVTQRYLDYTSKAIKEAQKQKGKAVAMSLTPVGMTAVGAIKTAVVGTGAGIGVGASAIVLKSFSDWIAGWKIPDMTGGVENAVGQVGTAVTDTASGIYQGISNLFGGRGGISYPPGSWGVLSPEKIKELSVIRAPSAVSTAPTPFGLPDWSQYVPDWSQYVPDWTQIPVSSVSETVNNAVERITEYREIIPEGVYSMLAGAISTLGNIAMPVSMPSIPSGIEPSADNTILYVAGGVVVAAIIAYVAVKRK